MPRPRIAECIDLYNRRRPWGDPLLTQRELARRIGCSESLISRWRHGKRRMSPEMIAAVADLLGCTTEDISGDVG